MSLKFFLLPISPLTAERFRRWLMRSAPGASLEYHRGHLIWDRAPASDLTRGERQALCRIADAALEAAERGLVHLVQRRNGPFDFSYLAILASRGTHRLAASAAPPEGRPPLWSRRLSPRSSTVSCRVFA
jgi:hypothetical protein